MGATHTNLARAEGCPPSRSGYCTRNRNAGPYHAIRGITLSAGSHYPQDHTIRRITLSAVSRYPSYHAIRRITLSAESRYPRDDGIRRVTLYAVAGTLGRALPVKASVMTERRRFPSFLARKCPLPRERLTTTQKSGDTQLISLLYSPRIMIRGFRGKSRRKYKRLFFS